MNRRVHIVMVPGFGGFDAFGSLRYYAGVTDLYAQWIATPGTLPSAATTSPPHWPVSDPHKRAATVLHYFDNHPTAGVQTRAALLEKWLAKAVARGDIRVRGDGEDDRVVLVGHSTGGLDIRCLLGRLQDEGGRVRVDGPGRGVPREELLRLITRVVFLSVPQHGTNVADFIASRPLLLPALLRAMRLGVTLGTGRWKPAALDVLSGLSLSGPGIGVLASDVLRSVNQRFGCAPLEVAEAMEELALIRLWLDRALSDSFAIDTLSVNRGDAAAKLPDALPDGVTPLSFVTRAPPPDGATGPTPLAATSTRGGVRGALARARAAVSGRPVRDGTPPRSDAAVAAYVLTHLRRADTDVFYRLAWFITSAGPWHGRVPGQPTALDLLSGAPVARIEPWENDGIANTSACLWAGGTNRLVESDHGDIIGHYDFLRASASAPSPAEGCGDAEAQPRYDAYDMFISHAGFKRDEFVRVWNEVLDFAALA